jgi:hypothetical protein
MMGRWPLTSAWRQKLTDRSRPLICRRPTETFTVDFEAVSGLAANLLFLLPIARFRPTGSISANARCRPAQTVAGTGIPRPDDGFIHLESALRKIGKTLRPHLMNETILAEHGVAAALNVGRCLNWPPTAPCRCLAPERS